MGRYDFYDTAVSGRIYALSADEGVSGKWLVNGTSYTVNEQTVYDNAQKNESPR